MLVDPTVYAVGDTQEELHAAMERLYIDMDHTTREAPDPTRRATDRVPWIGGSDAETGDPAWRSRVEAVLMTERFGTVIREHPGRDPVATARAVSELSGAAVVSWMPRLENPSLAASIRARSQLRVIELSEYTSVTRSTSCASMSTRSRSPKASSREGERHKSAVRQRRPVLLQEGREARSRRRSPGSSSRPVFARFLDGRARRTPGAEGHRNLRGAHHSQAGALRPLHGRRNVAGELWLTRRGG